MDKKQYNKVLEELNGKNKVYLNGTVVDADIKMVATFVEDNDVATSTVESNKSMCETILDKIVDKFDYWSNGSEVEDAIQNLSALSLIVKSIGGKTKIKYPHFEKLIIEGINEDLYLNALKCSIKSMYTDTLGSLLEAAAPYIINRVHVGVDGNKLIGTDGSYFDLADSRVKYGSTPSKPITVQHEILKLPYFKEQLKHEDGDVAIVELMKLLSAFVQLLNHNASVAEVSITNYEDMLNFNMILKTNEENEIDLHNSLVYLTNLSDRMLKIAMYTKVKLIPIVDPIMDLIPGELGKMGIRLPDMAEIAIDGGITITIKGGTLSLELTTTIGDKYGIFRVGTELDPDISKEATVHNLCLGTCTPLGDLIRKVISELGILDLYLQSPRIHDRTIKEHLENKSIKTFVTAQKSDNGYVYMLNDDTLQIGQVSRNIFIASVLITTTIIPRDYSITTRFRNEPTVRKLTPGALKEIRKYIGAEDFNMVSDKLAE